MTDRAPRPEGRTDEEFRPWLVRQIQACDDQMRAAKHQTKRARFADSALLLSGILQEFDRREAQFALSADLGRLLEHRLSDDPTKAVDASAILSKLQACEADLLDTRAEWESSTSREASTFAELLERRAEVQRLTADLAAAREENAKWSKCDSLVCPYEQRMREAESQLAAATEARERLKVWLQGEMAAASATINNTQPNGPTESFYAATGLHAAYRATLAKLSDAQRPVGPADKE